LNRKALYVLVALGLIGCLSLPLFFSGCADRFFYQPDGVEQPLAHPIAHQVVTMRAADGARLNGWFLHASGTAKATIVFLHGNTGNLTVHVPFVAWLPAAGYNVLAFDYRGYGRSEGKPSRQHVIEDARTAYFYARSRKDVDPERMILLGQSLGAANAIALAGLAPLPGLRAVVADSAFASYERIVGEKFLGLPYGVNRVLYSARGMLVSDELSPEQFVGKIAPVPLLLIAGDADDVVPASHSVLLYARAHDPKVLWIVHGARHIEALIRFRARLEPALVSFLDAAVNGGAISGGKVEW